ncbi:FAD-binding oxidoreductase [Dyadobacter sp. NIV53]|uniref:NAD(P)/FAD-dependent oxidoreductase n=1 Tax=Dyadobacter sp. NIV53 TaxID=2861765 RepID=UPI001C87EF14|nr:FAD-binding oxidoreductase [Dyadobacter sp. NIV53]
MNSTDTDFDYLIIGHGIGGASVAWHLHESGQSFQIINDDSSPSSSRVAAGIFNPLTGKKLAKTWLADDLFPYAESFYSGLEEKLHAKFIHPAPIYRPFRSIEEQNTYLAYSGDSSIAHYIGESQDQEPISEYVRMEYGGLEVVRSGWIDLPLLLDKSKEYFSQNGQYLDKKFDINDLNINDNYIEWKGKKYAKIILCQGFAAVHNRMFDWLAFNPVKGQILEVATEKAIKPYIINQGIFILPVTENTFRLGATYSWDDLDWECTDDAAKELEDKLKQLIKIPYTVTGQSAGIRPSVMDRRPLVGIHPEYNNVCIFNGLGTKGVTLAPFFANEFVQHLVNNKELNPLANIKRYFSLYFH